jgi:hypothetical protein
MQSVLPVEVKTDCIPSSKLTHRVTNEVCRHGKVGNLPIIFGELEKIQHDLKNDSRAPIMHKAMMGARDLQPICGANYAA